jgi:hypothetical protein
MCLLIFCFDGAYSVERGYIFRSERGTLFLKRFQSARIFSPNTTFSREPVETNRTPIVKPWWSDKKKSQFRKNQW